MKQRYLKKPCSFLLVSAMVLTMFPTFSTSVHAEENQSPTKEQFSTVEELKNYDTNDNDGVKNPAKVYSETTINSGGLQEVKVMIA